MRRRLIPNDLMVAFRPSGALMEALVDLGVPRKKAERLLGAFPDGRGLPDASPSSLVHLGLSTTQARRVIAAFRVAGLCDEACHTRVEDMKRGLARPQDVVDFLRRAIGRKKEEWFAVVLLDARQRVIDVLGVSIGSLAQVDVHPRELFREAVRRSAHSVILAHNHPSGDVEPSEADLAITNRLAQVGALVGIPVLDHLVVTPYGHTSLRERGLVPHTNPTARKSRKNRPPPKKRRSRVLSLLRV